MKRLVLLFMATIFVLGVSYYFIDESEVLSGVPESVDVYDADGYFYSSLSLDEKKAYDLIMAELYDFPDRILVNELSEIQLDRVFEAILYDNSDISFLDDSCTLKSISFKNYFYPEYCMEKDVYENQRAELDKVEDEIVRKAMTLENDYDREMYIHETVTSSCEYIDKTGGNYSSAYGCLINGKASCEGYAKAVKKLLDKCKIENHFAIGKTEDADGEDVGHIWNVVKINGDFYHLDATWDDADEVTESKYTYFNINDDEIQKTHKVDSRFLGDCESTEENYFIKNNLFFDEYNDDTGNIISNAIAEFADKDVNQIGFKFSNDEAFKSAFKALVDEKGMYRILVRADMMTSKSINTRELKYLPDEMHNILRIVEFF